MRTRMIVSLLAAAALALPAAAVADHGGGGDNSGPGHGGHGGHGLRLDTYNLKGTLSGYTAAVGTTPGSITVRSPNNALISALDRNRIGLGERDRL